MAKQVYNPIDGETTFRALALYIGHVWREEFGISGQILDLLADWVEQYDAYWTQVYQDEGRKFREFEYARNEVQRLLARVNQDEDTSPERVD